jgi:hypothetical protein
VQAEFLKGSTFDFLITLPRTCYGHVFYCDCDIAGPGYGIPHLLLLEYGLRVVQIAPLLGKSRKATQNQGGIRFIEERESEGYI